MTLSSSLQVQLRLSLSIALPASLVCLIPLLHSALNTLENKMVCDIDREREDRDGCNAWMFMPLHSTFVLCCS